MKKYIFLLAIMVLSACSEETEILDFSRIDKTIGECNELYTSSVEGSGLGEFVVGSKDIFGKVIKEAEYVRNNTDRQSALDNYSDKLETAKMTFLSSKVKPASLVFDGTGYIDCGSSLKFYHPEMTFEIWVYLSDETGGSIWGCEGHDGVTWDGMLLRLNESDPTSIDYCIVNNTWSSCLTPSGSISKNEWTHIAVTFNKTEAKVFINGELKGRLTISEYIPTQDHIFKIGDLSMFSGRNFRGKMFDFRAWSVVRTEQEIKDNYKKLLSGTEPGLVANWTFVLQGANSILDSTGNYWAELNDVKWGDFDNDLVNIGN